MEKHDNRPFYIQNMLYACGSEREKMRFLLWTYIGYYVAHFLTNVCLFLSRKKIAISYSTSIRHFTYRTGPIQYRAIIPTNNPEMSRIFPLTHPAIKWLVTTWS